MAACGGLEGLQGGRGASLSPPQSSSRKGLHGLGLLRNGPTRAYWSSGSAVQGDVLKEAQTSLHCRLHRTSLLPPMWAVPPPSGSNKNSPPPGHVFGYTQPGGLRCGCGVHHSQGSAGSERSQLTRIRRCGHTTRNPHSARCTARLARRFSHHPRCKLPSGHSCGLLQKPHVANVLFGASPPHTHVRAK